MFERTTIHFHNHYYGAKNKISKQLKKIQMEQEEMSAKLTALTEQTKKIAAEINAKLVELQEAIAAQGNVSPEVEAKMAALGAVIQGNDDLIQDLPAPTPIDGEGAEA